MKAATPGLCGSRTEIRARTDSTNLKALSLALLLVAIPGAQPKLRADTNSAGEYEVKAAFLFHFAQFVEWPAEAFKDAETPLTYCTMGEDVFRGALDESVMGKRINNRGLRVVHLRVA